MTEPEKRDCGCELKTLPRTVLPFMSPDNCKYPALLASHDEAAREIAIYMQTTKRLREERAALLTEKKTLQAGIKNAWSVIDELRGQLAATQDDKDALRNRVEKAEEYRVNNEKRWLSIAGDFNQRIAEQDAEIQRLRLHLEAAGRAYTELEGILRPGD